jgi:Flp pilus assembly protein TadG
MLGLQGQVRNISASLARKTGLSGSAVRRLLKSDSGGTLVEFALSASLVIAMLFAVIEFSFALYSYHFVNEVARNLSRYAMVRGSSSLATMPNHGFTDSGATLTQYARSTFQYPGVNVGQLTVTTTWFTPIYTYNSANQRNELTGWTQCASGAGCNAPGDAILVTATYPFLLSIPFYPNRTLNVVANSRMVISQ